MLYLGVSIPQSGLRRFELSLVSSCSGIWDVSIPQSGLRRLNCAGGRGGGRRPGRFQSPSRDYAGLNMIWVFIVLSFARVSIPQSGLRRFEPAAAMPQNRTRTCFNPPVGITPV